MSGISGIVNWDNSPIEKILLNKMTDIISHRGPDGLYNEVRDNVGFGYAKLVLNKSEAGEKQPLWLPDKSCAIVADARLYNRKELRDKVGTLVNWYKGEPSDAAIILSSYIKWGVELLDHIDGDFAFAIWDAKKKRVFAAKDPFGVKPFFYYWSPRRFFFGSEAKQILINSEVPVEPDHMIVGEYLFYNFEDVGRTFFKGVNRLKPAHYVLADHSGEKQIRYWNPNPQKEILYPKREDYIERFKELFRDAVYKRLISSYPVASQLSGGVDSSSIVVAAGDIYKNNGVDLPNFETLSAIFRDLPCDETVYIDSVSRSVPFNNHKFCPLDEPLTDGLLDDIKEIDSPFADIQRGTFLNCARSMTQRGAKILLTGLGGDELTYEEYYLRDLAIRGKYLHLLSEAWKGKRYTQKSYSWLLMDSLRAAAPQSIKNLYRKIRKHNKWVPSSWANKDFVSVYNSSPESPELPDLGFNSKTQEAVFTFLNFPNICWALEALECHSAYKGFEVRHPFFDRPLAEFVLSIPLEMRAPNGQWKYLLRGSLADELPKEVMDRGRKTIFNSYSNYIFEQGESQLRNIIFDSQDWASKFYISRENAIRLFDSFVMEDEIKSSWDSNLLWRITTLELWLRNFSCYN